MLEGTQFTCFSTNVQICLTRTKVVGGARCSKVPSLLALLVQKYKY
jgi:hypothetical protein